MSKMKTILFYICGRSGSGKDTIVKRILKENHDISLNAPITTRAMRVGEKDGVEYIFLTKEKFMKYKNSGKLLSDAVFHVYNANEEMQDDYYGYPAPSDQISITSGPWVILEDIRTNHPNTDEFKLIPIYIMPEHEYELLYRVMKRELRNPKPKIKEVARRFCADHEVYPKSVDEAISRICDTKVVVNIDLEKAIQEVHNIIQTTLKEELQ